MAAHTHPISIGVPKGSGIASTNTQAIMNTTTHRMYAMTSAIILSMGKSIWDGLGISYAVTLLYFLQLSIRGRGVKLFVSHCFGDRRIVIFMRVGNSNFKLGRGVGK
jgi:hypothetical protein